MNTIAIIGAGQLGSRHLQGVKRSNRELDIWVVDPNNESLKIAKERYLQVESPNNKNVFYINNISDLPDNIDFAIISTSSKPRLGICKQLLSKSNVKYLLLEKFLFTSLSEYDEANNLFLRNKCKVWVNCPRRMFEYYKKLSLLINKEKNIEMSYESTDWGMCCNSIHFIDIFLFLCGEQKYSLDLSGLNSEVKNSKRSGYIEFYGTEIVKTPKGNKLKLICHEDGDSTNKIIISNDSLIIEILENRHIMTINGVTESIEVLFQSQLSDKVLDSILENGNCCLTTYKESSEYHKIYLSELITFYNHTTGVNHDSCPIT